MRGLGQIMAQGGVVDLADGTAEQLQPHVEGAERILEVVRHGVRKRVEFLDERLFFEPGLDGMNHLLLGEGLGDEIVRTELHAPPRGQAVDLGGNHDHRQGPQIGIRPKNLQQLEAGFARHGDVRDDQGGFFIPGGVESRRAVGRHHGAKAIQFEHVDEGFADRFVVLDDQDSGAIG